MNHGAARMQLEFQQVLTGHCLSPNHEQGPCCKQPLLLATLATTQMDCSLSERAGGTGTHLRPSTFQGACLQAGSLGNLLHHDAPQHADRCHAWGRSWFGACRNTDPQEGPPV